MDTDELIKILEQDAAQASKIAGTDNSNPIVEVLQSIAADEQAALAEAAQKREQLQSQLTEKQVWLSNARLGVDLDEYRRVEIEVKLLSEAVTEAEDCILRLSGRGRTPPTVGTFGGGRPE